MTGAASRAFEDAPELGQRAFYHDNVLWMVKERPAKASDTHCASHLIFESDGCIRRVRTFPSDWRDLATEDLYELSWGI